MGIYEKKNLKNLSIRPGNLRNPSWRTLSARTSTSKGQRLSLAPTMASELSDAEADHDPVIAEYDIYITPPNESQQLYVLQYPNRARDDTSAKRKPPSGMRIKPSSGFMEIDMPIHFTNYDKTRGMRWGESMKQAQEDGVSSFGMAGGFAPFVRARGRHGPVSRRREDGEREAANGDMDIDEPGGPTGRLGAAFEQAREQGRVLASQTLGGQIVDREPGRPLYMVAAFQGRKCCSGR